MSTIIAYGLDAVPGQFGPVTASDELGGSLGTDLVVCASTIKRSNAGAAVLYGDANTTTITIGGGASNTLITIGGSGITADFPSGSTVDLTGATVTGFAASGAGSFGFLNVGASTTAAVADGDLASGDGTRSMFWDASDSRLEVAHTTSTRSLVRIRSGAGSSTFSMLDLITDNGGTLRGGDLTAWSSTYSTVSTYDLPSSISLNASSSATNGLGLNTFAAAPIKFYTNTGGAGGLRWQINSAGHMLAGTDNTYDIGASGATRPRTIYARTGLVAQGATNSVTLADGSLTQNAGTFVVVATAGVLQVRAGGANPIELNTNGAVRWLVTSAGHFLAVADNTYDIGAAGATRPRTGYFGTALNVGNGITPSTANGDIVAGDGTNRIALEAANGRVYVTNVSAATATTVAALVLHAQTTGTAAVGFGPKIEFAAEGGNGGQFSIGEIDCVLEDATNPSVDGAFDLRLMRANIGQNLTARFRGTDLGVRMEGGLEVGTASGTITGAGDIVAGDGTRSMTYDASAGTLAVAGISAAAAAGHISINGSVNDNVRLVVTNTNAGTAATSQMLFGADLAQLAFEVTSSTSTGTFGANACSLQANGASSRFILYTNQSDPIEFWTNNVQRWLFDASGHFLTPTDNSYDIGASGATRPRTGYFGTSVVVPSISSGASLTLASTTTSDVTIDSGTTGTINIGVDATNAKTLNLDSGTTGALNVGTSAFAKTITLGNATGATTVDINSGSGGIAIDSTGAISIDTTSTGTSNFSTSGTGSLLVLEALGGGTNVLQLTSAGSGANAIDINATAGGVDIDAADGFSIDATNASSSNLTCTNTTASTNTTLTVVCANTGATAGDATLDIDASSTNGTALIDIGGTNADNVSVGRSAGNLGFYGATPVAKAAAYTPTNVSTDRSYNANATTLDEVADVLGTLIGDLQALGLIG